MKNFARKIYFVAWSVSLTAIAFGQDGTGPANPNGVRHLIIDFGGRKWRIHLTPGALELEAFAVIMFFFAVTLVFAFLARRRAKEAEAAVRELQAESLERSRAEASVRDITERKEKEEQLRVQQEELNVQLAQVNRQLAARNLQMEQANRLMSEFLTGMSHELRTPLHTIIGFSELLSEELEGPLNEKQHRFVSHVHRDALHLLDLINALLDLSKIEAGKLELKRSAFGVEAMLDEVLASMRVSSDAKSIAIEVNLESGLEVYADRLRFKQILLNLLSNAVKFTPERGRIEVTCRKITEGVEFSVLDNGVGIPSENRASIFDKFYQVAASVNGESQGTGLGLAITKALVERHGGRIWLDSELGQGSCFTFCLPARTGD